MAIGDGSVSQTNTSTLEKAAEILEKSSKAAVSRNREYPFDGSEEFDPSKPFGEFDVIAVGNGKAVGFEVGETTADLREIMNDLSSGRAYLEKEGFDYTYNALVNDEAVRSLKQTAEELGPIFSTEKLESNWEDSGSLEDFHSAKVLWDLRHIPRTGAIKEDRVIARVDYEMLEEEGFIESEEGYYSTTRKMDSLLSETQPVYHVSPRLES
ncbi:MAG: hypothetical protein ABEJ91_00315, partial [Candidatus Nanohaloarchaea archaeon]